MPAQTGRRSPNTRLVSEQSCRLRGVAITTVGNALPPAAMLITQVLLAQRLGVSGRGTVAASTAPLMFAVAFLTLGLPEAVTYFVARRARRGMLANLVPVLKRLPPRGLSESWRSSRSLDPSAPATASWPS